MCCGLTLRQPWAGVLMHQWLQTSPTPFPVKATLALKAENMGWSSLGRKTVNLRAIRFPFAFKKPSSMTLLSMDMSVYQAAGNHTNWVSSNAPSVLASSSVGSWLNHPVLSAPQRSPFPYQSNPMDVLSFTVLLPAHSKQRNWTQPLWAHSQLCISVRSFTENYTAFYWQDCVNSLTPCRI